ncbi:MAG: gliding motility-associated C-terminal domain-containing protein [Saprospiraceae bacterium]|nr:gliding motility-associated C-terminal domain-containing protein [Saprospiraceae bacterium]
MLQHDRIKSQIGYFTNHPNLELITNDSILTSAARDFEVNFNIKNPFVNSALHPWISIQSLSGLSTNFKLFKQPQNQTIAQQNDVFNIPAIPGFSQVPYKLTGTNLNCQTDSVLIIFGWDCGAVSSLAEASCYRDTYLIRINLLDSELELDVLQEHTPIDLCDTTEYFEFEIYNAKLGYTYDLFGTVRLPQNMQIVPGSSQIYYEPAGAWVNIPDPESLGSNLFRWNISENQPQIALTGLPGILSEPSNAVKIRFKAIPLCGYVANTAIVYGTYGKQACGRSTNVLNKPGEPININGINPTYGVVVSVQPLSPDTIVCGDIRTYQVELNLLGTPSVGDSVYILLPAGASLIANSYTPGVNAPAGPPTLNPEGFSLPLPSLTGGGTMNFLYGLQFSAAAGCEDQLMAVQTRVHTEAFCVALGAPCDIYVSTGEALLVLPIKNPELTLQNLSASVHGNEMEISTNISNISEVTAPGALVQIWFDADGNQQLSSMDVLITTMSSAGAIAAGAQENLSATTTFDPSFMCSLIAVMPADENCSCDDVILPLENWQFYHDTTAYCDLSPIQIGISETGGSTYHWLEPASGIACLTCSSTTFTPDANTPLGTLVSLNLLETNGTCKINHQFSFTFGAGATISINNAVICEGTSATLTAGPGGQSYQWQGPGIVNPADASQTLTPSQTSTYAVTITYANGCTATAVSQINVLPSDSIFYPVLNVCEGEHINLFGEDVIATTGTFYKAYIKSNGCDSVQVQPVLLSPKLNTESSVIICAGESIQVFDTLINESGQVCRTFFSSITGCDSVHCVNATVVPKLEVPEQDTIFKSFGESIELGQGIVGFDFYNWIPQPNPPCNNCPTITVTPDSAGYFEYWQTVGNTVGCPDTVIWRVFVFPPCDVQHVDIPNAFTPNGDGANDVFQAIPSEGGELIGLLIVYDRWGEKVFESRGVLYWDGTIDGKPAPSDVYVYLIEVDCGEIKGKRVGDVTLIR